MPEADDPPAKEPAPPPAPQVPTDLGLHLRCTYCHDALVVNAGLHCGACLAPHHPECVQHHGACAAPGCGGTRFVRPEPVTVAPSAPRPRKRRGAALALVLAGMGAALAWQLVPGVEGQAPAPAPAVVPPTPPPPADLPVDYRGIPRVLYVDDLESRRAARVQHLLEADPTVDLTVRGRPSAAAPEQLLLPSPSAFDLVLLGPLDPEQELHAMWLQELRQAVQSRGVGLVVAGERSVELESSGLSSLLPVDVDAGQAYDAAWDLELTAAGRRAPALRIADTWERSWEAWAALPRFVGHAGGRRARAGAEVLAVAGGAPVLGLATRGEGQVLWVGFDLAQPWTDNALHTFLRAALHALARPAPETPSSSASLVVTRSWRLQGPIRRLVSDLETYGDAPVSLDPRVSGEVDLLLSSATWHEALQAAAHAVDAGVIRRPAGGYLVTPAAKDWPFVVVEAIDPSHTAPAAPSAVDLDAVIASSRAYLLDQQEPNGTWSGDGALGASALATLALLADPAPSEEVRRALAAAVPWIEAEALRQGGSDLVAAPGEEKLWHRMRVGPFPKDPERPRARYLSYALAAHAAVELQARYPKRPTLATAARRYLERLLTQRGAEGGWRLDLEMHPNALSTAFAVAALEAALTRETPIEEAFRLERALNAARRFLESLFRPPHRAGYASLDDGVSLAWRTPGRAPQVPLLLAAVVSGLSRSGAPRNAPELQAARLHLYGAPLDPKAHEPLFALLLSRELDPQSEASRRWADGLAAVLASQSSPGSWADATASWPSAGLCGSLYGRLGTTAVALLCLEAIREAQR